VFVPGGSWFFTVNLLDRRSHLLVDQIELLRHSIFRVKRRLPFRIEAMVVLPDHLHTVWTLPPDNSDFPTRWRLIKTHFAKRIAKAEALDAVRRRRGERAIWQRRYWEHYIRDDDDLNRHIAYCYFNPVRHGLVQHVGDWPYSTFRRDVRAGREAPDFHAKDAFEGIFGD
jgi:putative transposase